MAPIKVGLVGVLPFLGAGLHFLLATTMVGLVLVARSKRIKLSRDDKGVRALARAPGVLARLCVRLLG